MFYLLKCFIQMKILINNNDLNEALFSVTKLGYVPTMGGLHKGHISLIKSSLKLCNKTIVSIFVNPTQFNSQKDFLRYPRNKKLDLSILKKLGVNYVFIPNEKDIYGIKRKSKIKLNKKDKVLCAKFRKGHFEGVIDVMDRLTKLIKPKKIFMGEKDYQQLHLVKEYIEKNYESKIIPCRTIRDNNNLALSSRNIHLNKTELIKAGKLASNIIDFKKNIRKKKNLKKIIILKRKELEKEFNISIEYFELRNKFNLNKSNESKNSKIFIAYYLNEIRLIDNF
ncbi:MAG: pantoate--beta-alanine ligase [Candidatus Pelagibacter sp.]